MASSETAPALLTAEQIANIRETIGHGLMFVTDGNAFLQHIDALEAKLCEVVGAADRASSVLLSHVHPADCTAYDWSMVVMANEGLLKAIATGRAALRSSEGAAR